jgi:amino acid permease
MISMGFLGFLLLLPSCCVCLFVQSAHATKVNAASSLGRRLSSLRSSAISLNQQQQVQAEGLNQQHKLQESFPDPAVDEEHDGRASIPALALSLTKTIVGASCFGLPGAIALFGGSNPAALIPASLMISSVGAMSAYGFSLVGRVCAYTGAKSYQEAWEKTLSPRSAWVVSAASMLVCTSATLAYTMVLVQTLHRSLHLPKLASLISLTIGVLFPLCRLKRLSLLAPFSLVGIVSVLYTVLVMGLRCLQGSYAVGGQYFHSSRPITDTIIEAGGGISSAAVLLSMLATAFSCHYNAPKIYRELENNTIPRFRRVVTSGFLGAGAIYLAIAAFGYLTFGKYALPMVLHNYSYSDKLINIARMMVSVSLLTSYPMCFVGLREGLLDILKIKSRSSRTIDIATSFLLTFIGTMSMVVKDLGAVWSIGGATYGTALTIYIPQAMFLAHALKNKDEHRKEVPLAAITGILGVGISIVGTYRAITNLL